jgi:hypothetical protein
MSSGPCGAREFRRRPAAASKFPTISSLRFEATPAFGREYTVYCVLIHAVDAGSLEDEPTTQLADEIAYDAGDRTAAMTNAPLLVTASRIFSPRPVAAC